MRAALFIAVIATAGCGSSSGPATASTSLHGEVSDRAGDAVADSRLPVAPDLVRATADVVSGTLTLVIQFAPGTFDRQTTRVSVLLDTDQDGSTGIRQPDGIGADYNLEIAAANSLASVTKANPAACAARGACFDSVGSAPITLVGDGLQVAVPLSLLGNDDGRLNFQMNTPWSHR